MVGRALRVKEDGSNAIILDNAKLWKTHGLITKEHEWRLDGIHTNNRDCAVENERGEVIERKDEILEEVKNLDMEQIDEIGQNSVQVIIHLRQRNRIIFIEKFVLSSFPDCNHKVAKHLLQLKSEYIFDVMVIDLNGIYITYDTAIKKNGQNGKKTDWSIF